MIKKNFRVEKLIIVRINNTSTSIHVQSRFNGRIASIIYHIKLNPALQTMISSIGLKNMVNLNNNAKTNENN